MSDVAAELRLDRLESDMRDVKATLGRLEPLIIRIDERLNSTLPHLATKTEVADQIGSLRIELADKPGKAYLAATIAVLLAAYALGLAGLAALPGLRHLGG